MQQPYSTNRYPQNVQTSVMYEMIVEVRSTDNVEAVYGPILAEFGAALEMKEALRTPVVLGMSLERGT